MEDEAINYQVKGLKENHEKTLTVISELKIRRKDISNKFKNKTQINPDQYKAKIEGSFTPKEFSAACLQWLNINKKSVNEYRNMNKCTEQEAYNAQIALLSKRYL